MAAPEREYEIAEKVNLQRQTLPEAPGVYRYQNELGRTIYVGKAKNLRRRVNSYFTKSHKLDLKTRNLVRQIRNIEYTVTADEMEALLLENNLIKELQPRYNLMLKDGKSYPYICIKNERFPRVFSTRKRLDDGSQYFGPYPSGGAMFALLDFIRDNYKLRNCNLQLSEKNIEAGKFRPCLEFHIGNCKAPCVGKQDQASYDEDIRQIRQLLRGKFKVLTDELKAQLQTAVAQLEFERAHWLKIRLEQLAKHKKRSTVVSEQLEDVEVVTAVSDEGLSIVNHFRIQNGMIVGVHVYEIRAKNEESEAEMVAAVIYRLLLEQADFAPLVLTNVQLEEQDWPRPIRIKVPERGDEKKVLDLSLKNCETLLLEKLDPTKARRRITVESLALDDLKKYLGLAELPRHIECFDNSHIQGYALVSSCVVFRDGKPAKKDYRVYKAQNIEGIDDFATMREVVGRRYRRVLDDGEPLPDLIVIDGGKGQLSSALEALEALGMEGKVPVIGIAKRLEEIYFRNDPVPLHIDKKSAALKLLQRIRNEAHDTAITYHRKKRSEKTLKTELTDIPGVGPATAKLLLTEFRSVAKVKSCSLQQLAAVVGKIKAQRVYQALHPEGDSSQQDELGDELQGSTPAQDSK